MDRNPQLREMADESMVRNLAAQAEAIWPQEEPLFRRYAPRAVLDIGCGTGEITSRLANLYPDARLIGIDLIDAHLALARDRYASIGDRLQFTPGDAFELAYPADSFDLSVCRHVLQAVPEPQRILAEMVRVTRPGGYLHVLAEDYGMIIAPSSRVDTAKFWFEAPLAVGRSMGCDNHIGRHVHGFLKQLPVDDIRIDYLHIDTLRCTPETIAQIFTAWRDGYLPVIAETTGVPEASVRELLDATIEAARTGYALWTIPIASARVQ
ncbi:MAG: methyltransferase domain-containing protein [Kofleriaceae bacterium]